jgi:hypothetical protein
MTELAARSASAWAQDATISSDRVADVIGVWSSQGIRDAELRPLNEQPAEWMPEAVERVRWLIQDAGVYVSARAQRVVGRLLLSPAFQGTPTPLVGPAGEGGLSIEFRAPTVDFHIEVDANGRASTYVAMQPGVEWEGPLEDVPDGVEKWAFRVGLGH